MKLNIYGHQPIIAPRDPELPMEVTTKNYVDTLVGTHASDFSLHLTPSQNAWLDAITVTAEEVNSLAGATNGGLQTQIDQKVNRSGDVMTGALTLYGSPSENLHAAPKQYVDSEAAKLVAKSGGTMTGFLVLHADPTTNMQAAPKQYVDSSIVSHANNTDLHLTTAQNTWIDSITATASEVNQLVGVSSPVQTQLNSKFDKAGGEVTGDITLAAGKAVFVSKAPVADTELVNKAYVDSRVRGQEWKDPVTAINLVSLSAGSAATAYFPGVVYIIGSNPDHPELIGKDGYAFFVDSYGSFNTFQDRPVAVGDRFGVNTTGSSPIDGDLLPVEKGIITITDATPGAIQYTADNITAGSTVLVFDPEAPHFGETWSFTDDGQWVLVNTSVNLTSGDAISINGNTVNVNYGEGLTLDINQLTLKLGTDNVLYIDSDGFLALDVTGGGGLASHVDGGLAGLRLSSETVAAINDRLSKSTGGTVTGEVTFDSNGSLILGYTPILPGHAVTKHYVDSADTNLQGQVTTLQGKVATLETDPTTKTYVDGQVGTKVSKAGDTMTGYLVLHAAPLTNMQAANKQYVDSSITAHVGNDTLHLTPAQNTWIDAITATAQEVNYLNGVSDPIQPQLDSKVNKSGGTMTGPLILSGAPTNNLEAATKQYVDNADALKVNKAGDTLTGPLVLASAPTADLEASTKKYVDDSNTALNTTLTTQVTAKVSKAGDTMTGPLTLSGAPSASMHATPKQYVDDSHTSLKSYVDNADATIQGQVTTLQGKVATLETDPTTKTYVDDGLATKLDKAGGVLTNYLTLHADPQQAMHAVTKQYVDAVAQGLSVKPAVRLATTTNLAANYNNGTMGVSATLTGTTNGAIVVDGVTPVVGDRILVKNQTLKAHNGDYVVQQVGNASTPFILKRVVTVDESHEVPGSYFYVFDGATLKGTGWSFIVDNPVTFAIGTDDINVFQFSGQGNLIAGNGLVLSGNTIDINTANSGRIVINQDSIDLATTGVTPGSYTKFTVDGYGRVLSASNPTTLAGYGIADAQALNANLTSLSSVSTVGILVRDAGNQMATRSMEVQGVGLSITNPAGTSTGNIVISSNATSAATGDTVVSRDVSGNFSANIITAALSGNASTATTLQNSRNFAATGDVTAEPVSFNGGANVTLNTVLSNTGVVAGEYTKVTVDAKGRIAMGSNPTTVGEMGLVDAATIDFVNSRFDELERKFDQLYLFVMGRI